LRGGASIGIANTVTGIALAAIDGDESQEELLTPDKVEYKFRCRQKKMRLVYKPARAGGGGMLTALKCTSTNNGWRDAIEK